MINKSKAFQFKRFAIQQHNSAMKVGTDGVLLGAWSTIKEGNLLDIGSGTGLISLMLAQRSTTSLVDAVEIESNAFKEALDNIQASSWSDRINAYNCSIQDFKTNNQYATIISNPPFFINSTKAPKPDRNKARHTDTLTFTDLIDSVLRLLKPNGVFSLILPVSESQGFIKLARKKELHLNQECLVKPNPSKIPKRILMEFSFSKTDLITEELTIETETRHQYTKEYISLTKDFYLNF